MDHGPSGQNIGATSNGNVVHPEWKLIMKRMNLRNALSAALLIGGPIAAASAMAQSQGGSSGMMGGHGDGWMGGGYVGMWLPILLVVAVAGLVVWIVAQKKK